MGATDDEIDVFIPAHSKDFPVLPLCVKSLQRYLRPRPARITAVCAESLEDLKRVLSDYPVYWLHETSVGDILPREKMPIFKWHSGGNSCDRSGWYYQQLLKYALRTHSRTNRYLVIDADTVLLRPTFFVRNGRVVFYRRTQFHEPYFRTYEKLLGYFPERQPSFITDYMILEVSMVDELLQAIEAEANGAKWYDAIIRAIEPNEISSFSEYETYGYYVSRYHPECFDSIPLTYVTLPRKRLKRAWIDSIRARRRGAFSISYHHYLR